MEDIGLTSNCNNRFEVSSLSCLCRSVLHSWSFWWGLALLSLLEHFHKVSVCCLVGKRKNYSTKKSFIWLFSVCFSNSIWGLKDFPTYRWAMVYFSYAIPKCVSENFLYFLFFFLNFWINKWMRAKSLFPETPSYVWWLEGLAGCGRQVLQLGQHGSEEGLQEWHQPVSRSQAARWWKVDEGRSPVTMIEWAVISKITQIPEEEWRHGFLHFLQSPWMQHRSSHIPPSVSGIKDVHSCLFQLLPDGPHINERVQFLWSSFHTAECLRTEATHVSISVPNILPCLF